MEQRTPRPEPSSPEEPLITPMERPGPPRAPARRLEVGDTIAGYALKDTIGEGGMGRVFLAHDPRLDRFVALKVLPPGASDEESRARFLREARALARVEHENVVRVHASGTDDDVAWMALEYIEGDPVDEVLSGAPLDEETALLLCAQACRGLSAVHAVGVIHRDVKPGNLLIDDAGVLRVVDFGVALMTEGNAGGFVTQAGVAVGTPHFMAPEQARGASVDTRVDAWAIGATLFMMVAGRPPFWTNDDESDLDILARVLREPAPDVRDKAPGVSAETAALLRRLLAPKPDDRLGDLDEVAALMEACADHAAGQGPMPTIEAIPPDVPTEPDGPAAEAAAGPAPVSPTRPSGWLRLGLVAGTVVLVLLATGVGWLLASNNKRTDDRVATVKRPVSEPEVDVVVDNTPPKPAPDEPPVQALPSPEELEIKEAETLRAAVIVGGPEGKEALIRLVELNTPPARKAVYELVANGPRSRDAVTAIGRVGARHHLETLTWALLQGPSEVGTAAASALGSMKSAKALELLISAERGHDDEAVRRAAGKARRALFSVQGED